MVFNEGIVLACERKLKSKLIVPKSIEKIHELDSHIACAVSGLFADAKTLMSHARQVAAVQHFYLFLLISNINLYIENKLALMPLHNPLVI